MRPSFSSLSALSRANLWLMAAFALFFGISAAQYFAGAYSAAEGWVAPDGQPVGRDFAAFWTAAQLLAQEGAASIYAPEVYAAAFTRLFGQDFGMLWAYPPPFLLLLAPFTLISSYAVACVLWAVISYGAFALALRNLGIPLVFCLLILISPMVVYSGFAGQTALLLGALTIVGFTQANKRPCLSGLAFALLGVKPQLALLVPVYLLATRNWPVIRCTLICGLALMAVSALAFGTEVWSVYLQSTLSRHGASVLLGANHAGTPTLYMFGYALSENASIAAGLQLITTAIIAAGCYRIYRLRLAVQESLMLFGAAFLCLTPYAFVYDTPLLAVSLCLAACSLRNPATALLLLAVWNTVYIQLNLGFAAPLLLLYALYCLYALKPKAPVHA